MSNHSRVPRPGRIASTAYIRRLGGILREFFTQLLVRIIVLAPVIAWYLYDLPGKLWHYALATAVLIILLLFPMRFKAGYTLSRFTRIGDNSRSQRVAPYSRLIIAGIIRLVCGLLWGIPLYLLLYRMYQYLFVLPATQFGRDFTAMGAFFAAGADSTRQMLLGTYIFFGSIFLALLAILYGWWRGVSFDFQMIGNITLGRALSNARRARRMARRQLWKNAVVHMLLCLPAIIVPLLIPYLKLRPMLSGYAMQDLQLIFFFLSSGMLSDGTLILSAVSFLVLYLPFLPYRKLRNAAAVVNCHAYKR